MAIAALVISVVALFFSLAAATAAGKAFNAAKVLTTVANAQCMAIALIQQQQQQQQTLPGGKVKYDA